MLTLIVEQEQVDKNFTLQELLEFSKKNSTRVRIRDYMTFENGVVTCLK